MSMECRICRNADTDFTCRECERKIGQFYDRVRALGTCLKCGLGQRYVYDDCGCANCILSLTVKDRLDMLAFKIGMTRVKEVCPDCKGTGMIHLFTSISPCLCKK